MSKYDFNKEQAKDLAKKFNEMFNNKKEEKDDKNIKSKSNK